MIMIERKALMGLYMGSNKELIPLMHVIPELL